MATLTHEARDHAVEGRALVVKGLATLPYALLVEVECVKVPSNAGSHVGIELHHDVASRLTVDGHVEDDLRVRHSFCSKENKKKITLLRKKKKDWVLLSHMTPFWSFAFQHSQGLNKPTNFCFFSKPIPVSILFLLPNLENKVVFQWWVMIAIQPKGRVGSKGCKYQHL